MNGDLKSQLMYQIDRISDDETALLRALNYVSSLLQPRTINRRGHVAQNIKQNTNIVVPIVCDDMFEYDSGDGQLLTITDFICEKYSYIDSDTLQAIRTNYYYGISLLEREEGDNFRNSICESFEDAINNHKIRLKESAKKFLSNGKFPLILTTFGFTIIEQELKELGINYKDEWYNPNYRNDLPLVENEYSRILYHIFGGNPGMSNKGSKRGNTKVSLPWVYDESTLLKFMHSLHSIDYGAKWLSNYLRGHGNDQVKRLLVLGASLPNWVFRFFVYPMYEEESMVGYWLSLDDIEKELDLFLTERPHEYTGLTNLRAGNKIDAVLAEATKEEPILPPEQRRANIFVSYKSEIPGSAESETINRVTEILDRQGNVWRDKWELQSGDHYWAKIKDAIKACDIFIPLVTKRYMDEFKTKEKDNKEEEETKRKLEELSKEAIQDTNGDNSNDIIRIKALKEPVVREIYYALAYKKKCIPIVILDENAGINAKTVDDIAKDYGEPFLPSSIFTELLMETHNDREPRPFNLPNIE